MSGYVEVVGQITGFAIAVLESGERAVLARAMMADGSEIAVKWCSPLPDDAREVAAFFTGYAAEQDAAADAEIKNILDGD